MKTINTYCRHCGKKLVQTEMPADQIEKNMYDSGGGSWWTLGSSFNPETGERNMATVHQCPDFARKWYGENSHDIFAVYKGDVEWGVRIKL